MRLELLEGDRRKVDVYAYAKFVKQTNCMWVTMAILTIFGAIIAFGVIYNQARIALSMRSRDLASLRVLGFLRSEISAVLLGELAVYVAVGIPLGFVFGRFLVDLMMSTVDPEGYRLPAMVSARTYAFSASATIAAALASALVVRRKRTNSISSPCSRQGNDIMTTTLSRTTSAASAANPSSRAARAQTGTSTRTEARREVGYLRRRPRGATSR